MAWPAIAFDPEEIPTAPTDYEIVQGERRPVAPVNYTHRRIVGALLGWLAPFVREHNLGDVGPEGGFVLARDPMTLLAPDISFVRRERVPPPPLQDQFVAMAPDLAVEVLSPSDAPRETAERVALYLAAGTPLVWVVNPRQRSVTVHRRAAEPLLLQMGDTLDGGDVLPGFSLPVSVIFG